MTKAATKSPRFFVKERVKRTWLKWSSDFEKEVVRTLIA